MSITLGVNKNHYLSQGDLKTRCPNCSTDNTETVGTLTVNGNPRDVHKCKSCNRLYSREDGGVASLVDEAKEVFKTENVGFTTSDMNRLSVDSSVSAEALDYQTKNNIEQIRQSLDSIKSSSYNWSNIQYKLDEMTSAMQTLASTVERLAQKNVDLMQKLATDPLVSIRKRVSDFNLE